MFLAIMRDESRRKEGFDQRGANHVTTDGMDAWFMMQRNQEKEMRLRRQEAEQLLRGYRGQYFSGEESPAWSPRSHRKSRSSFGLAISEILVDPATEKRRQTTMPRIEHNFDDPLQPTKLHQDPKSLDPEHVQLFENSGREQGTMGYDYNGRSIFRENNESREPAPTFDSTRVIDSTYSHGGMSHVSGHKSVFSTESRDREDYARTSFPAEQPDVPETIWREFISPGKHILCLMKCRDGLRRHVFLSFSCFVFRTGSKVSTRSWAVSFICLLCLPWIPQSSDRASVERIGRLH